MYTSYVQAHTHTHTHTGMPWLGACIHWLNVWGGDGCTTIGSGNEATDCIYTKDYERYMWLHKYQVSMSLYVGLQYIWQ